MSQIVHGKPQLPPGICFICEASNDVDYVDTLRDFEGIGPEKLDGRKYLCAECIEDAANKLGFASQKKVQELEQRVKVQMDFIDELRGKLDTLEYVAAALDSWSKGAKTITSTA